MKDLALLVKSFNERLMAHPGVLPDKIFVIELDEGKTFFLDKDQLAEGVPDGRPDCTIKTSARTLDTLLENPGKAMTLVMTGKLKFDKAGPVMLLAAALNEILAD